MGTPLEKLNVPELDALAVDLQADDYPANGKKDEKLAALRPLVGDEYEPKPVFTLTLNEDFNGGQFQSSNGKHIELTKEHPTFQTSDVNEFDALRELPFLDAKDAS
jgi:hypothetical protein